MKLSNNFTLEELTHSSTATANNINNHPNNEELDNLRRLCVEVLQPIRDAWNAPIYVNSGFRNPILNRLVGGSPSSYHTKGIAGDITTRDKQKNKRLFNLIVEMVEQGTLTIGELIDEHNYSWLHVTLPTDRDLNQIFHIK